MRPPPTTYLHMLHICCSVWSLLPNPIIEITSVEPHRKTNATLLSKKREGAPPGLAFESGLETYQNPLGKTIAITTKPSSHVQTT